MVLQVLFWTESERLAGFLRKVRKRSWRFSGNL